MNSELQKLVTAGKITQVEGNKLDKLEPGTACSHKSWGVGRIAEWDLLGDRVLIDFEGKPGHPMKLAFAADSLTALAPDHILARRVTDLPTLQALAKDKPAELVEQALKSNNGSMSLDDLEKIISPRIVPAAEYKKWWRKPVAGGPDELILDEVALAEGKGSPREGDVPLGWKWPTRRRRRRPRRERRRRG